MLWFAIFFNCILFFDLDTRASIPQLDGDYDDDEDQDKAADLGEEVTKLQTWARPYDCHHHTVKYMPHMYRRLTTDSIFHIL